MKLFKFTNRNHQAADTWRLTLKAKEDKKAAEKDTQITTTVSPIASIMKTAPVQHVICTAETLRKSAEEKLQIQRVHEELEQVRIIPQPILAF